jgi:TolB-like protein/class 3 adenylate cyclase/Tfp pilus assembly protein PilF
MSGRPPERRLAAILAADVAGYSRLMGADEEGTLARLKDHRRALIDPAIALHRGRIVKTMGDGLLVEFASAVEAVRCAIEIQQGMATRNADMREERRIAFRIGVNLGDVIAERDDIHGDGVNVAARLQALCEVGGVLVSRPVHDQVRDRLPVRFTDLGPQSVKNIARPVRVYRVDFAGYAAREIAPSAVRRPVARTAAASAVALALAAAGWWWFGRSPAPGPQPPTATGAAAVATAPATPAVAPRLSIVVLPFATLSDDREQEYLADAITEDLTTDLTRLTGSFIISRHSAFTYRGRAVDPRQIGRELGVRYVLEGSVRRTGDQVRLNAQLIDAESGAHLWAERFDRNRADLADLQNDLVARIGRTLQLELVAAEARRSAGRAPNELDATDLALRAAAVLQRFRSPADLREARQLSEQALQLDPRSVRGLTVLAGSHLLEVNMRVSAAPAEQMRLADEAVNRALDLAPNDAQVHFLKGTVLMNQRRLELAIGEFETAIALDRSRSDAYARLGLAKLEIGRAEELFAAVRRAIEISPRDPALSFYYFYLGMAEFHLGHDEAATGWMLRSAAENAQNGYPHQWLASIYALHGRDAEARAELAEFNRLIPGHTIASLRASERSESPVFWAQRQRWYEGLRRAGLPE